jgi:hypothetical protein
MGRCKKAQTLFEPTARDEEHRASNQSMDTFDLGAS